MKKKEKLLRNPYIRIFIVIGSILLVIAAIFFIVTLSYKYLFMENPRFTLKKISVNSSGYWNNRSNRIANILKLKKGSTNIFEVSPKILRQTLKEKKMYSIEDAEVSRVLPDTLKFDITERIPRALLYNRKSNLIVDKNGILINRKYCISINNNLPIITGFVLQEPDFSAKSYKNNIIPFGKELPQIMPALTLISLVTTDYPEFTIKLINLYDPNSLIVYMLNPQRNKTVKVIFHFKHNPKMPLTPEQINEEAKSLKIKLAELSELYSHLRIRPKNFSEISLMFKNQAIVK